MNGLLQQLLEQTLCTLLQTPTLQAPHLLDGVDEVGELEDVGQLLVARALNLRQ